MPNQVETQFMTLQKEEHEKKMNQLDELHMAGMEMLAVEKEIAIEKLESLGNSARLEQRSAPVEATYSYTDFIRIVLSFFIHYTLLFTF